MATDGLKQRLVGGATLLVVAVIAWFWLLSADSPVDPVSRESQIPAAPDIQPFAVQEPSAPQAIEPIGSERDSTPALQSDVIKPAAAVKPAAVAKPTDVVKADAIKEAARESTPPAKAPQPTPAVAPKKAADNSAHASSAKNAAPKAAPKPQPGVAAKAPAATPAPIKAEPKPAAGAAKDSKLAAETFQLDQHGLPIAWVVQVGLFSTQASADKIKATLQEKGFKAYTEPFKSAKASGIKVFVGPKLSRERADAQKKAIDELLKTNTMVVRFSAD